MLNTLRAEVGLTKKSLALTVGIQPTIYGELESGKRSPLLLNGKWSDPVLKLSDYFSALPEDLFPEHRKEEPRDPFEVFDLIDEKECAKEDPFFHAELKELQEDVRKVLATLPPRQEKILRLRFGIGEDRDYSLEEIALDYGVTRTRIMEIEAKALSKLKHPSRSKHLKWYVSDDNRTLTPKVPRRESPEARTRRVEQYREEERKRKEEELLREQERQKWKAEYEARMAPIREALEEARMNHPIRLELFDDSGKKVLTTDVSEEWMDAVENRRINVRLNNKLVLPKRSKDGYTASNR